MKLMTKRALALLFALMMLTAAACGSDSSTPDEVDTDDGAETTEAPAADDADADAEEGDMEEGEMEDGEDADHSGDDADAEMEEGEMEDGEMEDETTETTVATE